MNGEMIVQIVIPVWVWVVFFVLWTASIGASIYRDVLRWKIERRKRGHDDDR